MREFLSRLIDWFRRDRLERELAEEIRFHKERASRDARSEGASAADAPYLAQRRFGNTTTAAELARERWSIPSLDQLQQDIRYALRGLRRSPGFTATAVLTLALGIGGNVAMFGIVDRLMFRPYAYLRDPTHTHRLYFRATYRGEESWGYGDEYARYLDMRNFTTSFSELAGFSTTLTAVGSGEGAREQWTANVSASFWKFFDARPALGRYFGASEDLTPRGAEVSVISYAYWKNDLGGRNVLGEHLQVGDIPTTIIGVTPEGFNGVFDANPPAVYIPITLYAGSNPANVDRTTYFTRYDWGWMSTMVLRRPGVTNEQANADVTQAFRRSLVKSGDDRSMLEPAGIAGSMRTSAGPNAPLEARTALWVLGVAVVVLLIACANVANLFLGRALRRQREIAVRLALGVTRRRLMTQTLTESLVLSALGCVAGLVVAQWGGAAMRSLLISKDNASLDVLMDWRTLGVAAGAAVAAAILTAIAPALLSGRGELAATLKAGPREGTYHRSGVRIFLLVAQGALSVVLLIGATLFVQSLRHVRDVRIGFDADPVLLVLTNFRGVTIDSVQRATMRRDLLARAQATPGVASAAIATSIPFRSSSSMGLYVAGIDSVRKIGRFTFQATTPDYFRTFGTRILRGRGFTTDDRAGAPKVAVMSESAARALWPDRDALGQCLHVQKPDTPCTTIVGIAEDIVQAQGQLTDGKRFQYYLPLEQFEPQASSFLVVKMSNEPASQMEMLRKTLQPVMPGQSYVKILPMIDVVDATQKSWRIGANLFVAFGVLALLVAAVGLYGVMAYNVAQRMHELGVRVALGAQASDIIRLVTGQGARFAALGVIAGSALAYAGSRWVQPLLFQQSAKDPAVYGAVALLMLLVAIVASAAPARRATSADPNTALRSE
jgi:predicted permease